MDAKLVLPTLRSAGTGFSDFREALESMHTMLGAQFRNMTTEGVPYKLTEHGFLLISESLMDVLGNAQADLSFVVQLIEAMEQEEKSPAAVLSLSQVAGVASRDNFSGGPAN